MRLGEYDAAWRVRCGLVSTVRLGEAGAPRSGTASDGLETGCGRLLIGEVDRDVAKLTEMSRS